MGDLHVEFLRMPHDAMKGEKAKGTVNKFYKYIMLYITI